MDNNNLLNIQLLLKFPELSQKCFCFIFQFVCLNQYPDKIYTLQLAVSEIV